MGINSLYLRGVVKNGATPPVFDHRGAAALLESALNWIDEDIDYAKDKIKAALNIIEDCGDDLQEMIEKSSSVIGELHHRINAIHESVYAGKFGCGEPEELSRAQLLKLLEHVGNVVEEALPEDKFLADLLCGDWLSPVAKKFVSSHIESFGKYSLVRFDPPTDTYYFEPDIKGRNLCITLGSGGYLRVDLLGQDGVDGSSSFLGLTHGKQNLRFIRNDYSAFESIPESDFRNYFEDWTKPKKNELALVKVLHPDLHFGVLELFTEE